MARLESNQPLMFVREPSNPYDPAAVSVQTLGGEMLGYVPKEGDLNRDIKQGVSYGRVLSVGRVDGTGPFGAHAGEYTCVQVFRLPYNHVLITHPF